MSSRLHRLFSSRFILALVLLFSIANRTINVAYQSMIGKDKMLQLTVAENIISGKGYGVEKYYTGNTQKSFFDRSVPVPPGYSLMIIPFILLSGHDLLKASFLFELLVTIALFLAVIKLLKMIGFSAFETTAFALVLGCFHYPFFSGSPPTDTTALLFTLLSLIMMLGLLKRKKPAPALTLVFISFIFFLPAFFRFAYLPVCLILPLVFLATGYITKDAQLRKQGMIVSILTFTFLTFIPVMQKLLTGHFLPQYPDAETGFFPNNLLPVYPFLLSSFFNPDFFAQQIEKLTGFPYTDTIKFFEWSGLLFLPFLLYMSFFLLKNLVIKRNTGLLQVFLVTCSLMSCMIIFVIAYTTFTSSYDKFNQASLLLEARYFSFLIIFIQLLFFLLLFKKVTGINPVFRRSLLLVFGTLLALETSHGIYINQKLLFHFQEMKQHFVPDQDYRFFESFSRELKRNNRNLLVASTDRYYCNKAMLNGDKGLFDVESLNHTKIHVEEKSVLLLVIPQNDRWIMQDYINKAGLQPAATVAGTSFYIQKLDP